MEKAWPRLITFLGRPLGTRRQRLVLAALGVAILFLRFMPVVTAEWDYTVYCKASLAMLRGENPYPAADRSHFHSPLAELPYLYSPLFARLLTPLALMNPVGSKSAWVLIKCLCLVSGIFWILQLLNLPCSPGPFAALFLLVLIYQPIGLDMVSGNVATLEITAILGGLAAWRCGRPTLGGFFLALPIIVKTTCLLVLLYPLHRRAWRVLRGAGFAFVVIGLCTLPDWRHVAELFHFLRSPLWLDFWDELVQSYYNCSVVTVIQRTFGETYFVQPILPLPWLPPLLIPLAPILILILSVWAIARSEIREKSGALHHGILSLVLLTALLLPPRLAGYSLVWTLLPLGSLSYAYIRSHDWMIGLLILIGFLLIQINVHPEHAYPGIRQLLIDHYFFGLLSLYAASVRVVGWLKWQKKDSLYKTAIP